MLKFGPPGAGQTWIIWRSAFISKAVVTDTMKEAKAVRLLDVEPKRQ